MIFPLKSTLINIALPDFFWLVLAYSFLKKSHYWSSSCGSVVTNPTSIHEDVGLIPGPAQGFKDQVAVSFGIGLRRGLDPQLLWLGCRLAAIVLI